MRPNLAWPVQLFEAAIGAAARWCARWWAVATAIAVGMPFLAAGTYREVLQRVVDTGDQSVQSFPYRPRTLNEIAPEAS